MKHADISLFKDKKLFDNKNKYKPACIISTYKLLRLSLHQLMDLFKYICNDMHTERNMAVCTFTFN